MKCAGLESKLFKKTNEKIFYYEKQFSGELLIVFLLCSEGFASF